MVTAADLRISKDVDPDPLVAGADATYSLTVTNAGPSDAQNVTITDTLDPALTGSDADHSLGSCTLTGQVVSCTVPTLPAGGRRHGRHPGRRFTDRERVDRQHRRRLVQYARTAPRRQLGDHQHAGDPAGRPPDDQDGHPGTRPGRLRRSPTPCCWAISARPPPPRSRSPTSLPTGLVVLPDGLTSSAGTCAATTGPDPGDLRLRHPAGQDRIRADGGDPGADPGRHPGRQQPDEHRHPDLPHRGPQPGRPDRDRDDDGRRRPPICPSPRPRSTTRRRPAISRATCCR